MYTTNIDTRDNQDWMLVVSAIDQTTGNDVDFSEADEIVFSVKDDRKCERLRATLENGRITLASSTVIQCHFTVDDMSGLQPAQYDIGAVARMNGVAVSIFAGTVNVQDGVAKL